MLLTPQLKPFPPQTPKHFMHEKVLIQLQGLWPMSNCLLFTYKPICFFFLHYSHFAISHHSCVIVCGNRIFFFVKKYYLTTIIFQKSCNSEILLTLFQLNKLFLNGPLNVGRLINGLSKPIRYEMGWLHSLITYYVLRGIRIQEQWFGFWKPSVKS